MKISKVFIFSLAFILIILFIFKREQIEIWLEPEISTYEYYNNGVVKKISVLSKIDSINCHQYNFNNGNVFRKFCTDKNGINNGPYEIYYENGNRNQISEMLDGKLHGESTTYYKNGQILEKINYKNGLKEGALHHYNINGQLEAINYFSTDVLIHKRDYKYTDSVEVLDYETYRPLVLLEEDTIRLGQKINFLFSLPFDKEYEYGQKKFIIRYDYQKLSQEGGGVAFPKFKDTLKNGIVKNSFPMNAPGHHWLYGFVESIDGDTTIQYETFEKSFHVLKK